MEENEKLLSVCSYLFQPFIPQVSELDTHSPTKAAITKIEDFRLSNIVFLMFYVNSLV